MTLPVPPLRWWGWGERTGTIPPGLAALLRHELGIDTRVTVSEPPPPPRLPPVALPAHLLARLRGICGELAVDLSDKGRLGHAAGRSYLDLVRLRSGGRGDFPDAVVSPTAVEQVGAVLRACADSDCAVVPFGGGTSVVGGVSPLRGRHAALIALSLRRLNQLRAVDPVAMTATLEAGMTGPEVEAALADHGFTLGHFPQSFEYATVGGFAATRSAGQASSGFGRFDEMVLGLRCATAHGELITGAHPASAAGPSLQGLLLGSEGRFGVITEVTVAVWHRHPWRYEGWMLHSLRHGVAALRAMAQSGVTPDVARLSDEEETRVGLAMADRGRLVDRAARGYLRARGRGGGCLLIAGWAVAPGDAGARRRRARAALRRHGGVALGAAPGRAWAEGRYHGPFLRDHLLDAGALVETVETATSWTTLRVLHSAVVRSLREALGGAALVGAHISHVYPAGASLYFTVLAPAGVDPQARWNLAKAAATRAILANHGTITHHHAVGTDHREHLLAEIGERGVAALRAVAAELDPEAILNPGKLIPD